jgi:hypothetical protein
MWHVTYLFIIGLDGVMSPATGHSQEIGLMYIKIAPWKQGNLPSPDSTVQCPILQEGN